MLGRAPGALAVSRTRAMIPALVRRNCQIIGPDGRNSLDSVHDVPRVVIRDTLASDSAARGAFGRRAPPTPGLNNRAEHAHRPTRERERRIRRFKSPGHAQRFLAAYGPIASYCRPRYHHPTAATYRAIRAQRFATWRTSTGTSALA